MTTSIGRHLIRMSWQAALKCALAAGLLGVSLCAAGTVISDHGKPPEHAATAEVTGIPGCYRGQCSYDVSYITAQYELEQTVIEAPPGEARSSSQVTVYYQDAIPGIARFTNSDYPNDPGDSLFGPGVVLILASLVMLIASAAKLPSSRPARRRRQEGATP